MLYQIVGLYFLSATLYLIIDHSSQFYALRFKQWQQQNEWAFLSFFFLILFYFILFFESWFYPNCFISFLPLGESFNNSSFGDRNSSMQIFFTVWGSAPPKHPTFQGSTVYFRAKRFTIYCYVKKGTLKQMGYIWFYYLFEKYFKCILYFLNFKHSGFFLWK